jgi:hypothetical protein
MKKTILILALLLVPTACQTQTSRNPPGCCDYAQHENQK